MDKIPTAGREEYSGRTEEATNELKKKVSEKQLKRQSQRSMIAKAAKKHSQ